MYQAETGIITTMSGRGMGGGKSQPLLPCKVHKHFILTHVQYSGDIDVLLFLTDTFEMVYVSRRESLDSFHVMESS